MSLSKLSRAFSLIVLALAAHVSFAQDRVITGKVSDASGAPLSGVSVVAKGSTLGTQTDAAGQFRLSVSASVNALMISSVGFEAREVAIQGTTLNVTLAAAAASMEDVVVVAYGTRRKTDLTGSVVSVGAKDFQKGNIN